MRVIFLLGCLQGLILSLVLISRTSQQKSNKLLGILTFALSVQLGLTSEGQALFSSFPNLRSIAWTAPYLFAPLTFLYLQALLMNESFKWKHLIHLLPFLVSLVGLIPYFALEHEVKVNFDILNDSYFLNFAISFETIRVLQAVLYTYLIFRLLKNFKSAAEKEISNIPLRWVYQFVYASVTSWVTAFLSILVYFLPISTTINPFNLVYLLTLILIYLLGYKMLTSPVTFGFTLTSGTNESDKKRYTRSGLKSDKHQEQLQKLQNLMEDEQLYLDSELTVNDVAEKVGMSKHHFSQLINEGLHQNFFEFINRYRVEHAKKLLEDSTKDYLKILAIGYEAGFNSKSTFNSLFKQYTGQTPTRFRKEKRSI